MKAGTRFDLNSRIGAALRDRGCDCVMGARLIAVAGRPRTLEQPIDEHARAGTDVTIDHEAAGIGEGSCERTGGGASREPRIVVAAPRTLPKPARLLQGGALAPPGLLLTPPSCLPPQPPRP